MTTTLSEGWRYECPEGHVAVKKRINHNGGMHAASAEYPYYCKTCGQGYPSVRDKQTGRWL